MRKIDISEKISNTAYIPIAIIAAILMVIPVYILFMTSFAVPSDILKPHPDFFHHSFYFGPLEKRIYFREYMASF